MKLIALAVTGVLGVGCSVLEPGERGVIVTFGNPSKEVYAEGLHFRTPLFSSMSYLTVKQQTESLIADSFSSDLQQLKLHVSVLFRVPEGAVRSLLVEYHGNIFESLIVPRMLEATKEATALHTAEEIAKKREEVKADILSRVKKKMGQLLDIVDITINNIELSGDLQHAIEQKMVQEQAAEKAKYMKQQALIDAETKLIAAQGEAKSIEVTGEAIRHNPDVIKLRVIEKWNGVSPTVVSGSGAGVSIILPQMGDK